ncbi:hypothetical protein ABPG77_007768 [Micractinium sp. CCAP 211/92]
MAGPGQPELVAAAADKRTESKKRVREELAESSEHRGGEAEQDTKRVKPDEHETSTCHQGGLTDAAPDRASVEPAADGSPKDAQHQDEDGGVPHAKDDFDPLPKVVLEYVDITPMLNLPDVGLQWIPFPGAPPAAEDDGPLAAGAAPAVPGPAAEAEAAPVVAQPAGTANGAPAVELSLGAPADAQATDLPPPASLAAAPGQQRCDAAGPSAPSRQESALQPQCAVAMGAALDQEVSTAQLAPLPPREPSQQYNAVAAGLRAAIVPPEDTGVNWDHFPNFLGDGTRARLLALATLHLSPEATPAAVAAHAAYPTFAIKALPANSNKILLGAANNCELYQERVVRALAQKAGVPLLLADVYSLKLDDVLKEESAPGAGGVPDDLFGGGSGFPPDPWEASDEDDPFLGLGPKPDKKEAGPGAKDTSLDTALAMRKTTARRGMPGMAYYPLGLAGAAQRHPSLANAAAAAAAARAAAERAAAAAKAARERAAAASAAAAGARMPGGLPGYRPAPAAAGVTVHPAVGQPADPTAYVGAAATSQPAREARGASQPSDGGAPAAPAAEQEQKAEQQEDGGEGHAARRTLAAALSSHLPDAPQRLPSDAAAPGDPPAPAAGDAAEVSQSAQARAAVGAGARLTLARALTTPAGASQAGGGAAAATSAAVSKAAGPSVRLGDRVSYYGRQHPTMASAQEQLEQLQAAIQRVELSSSQRARDYLPQLLVRRSLVQAQQSQRAPRVQAAGAPPLGSRGRVVGVTGDKVQVALDEPFAGGSALPGHKEKCGFVCSADELQVVEDKEDHLVSSLQALFDVIAEAAQKGPLIVFVQNLDRLLRTHATDHFRKLESLLAALPPRCLLFAGYCSRSLARAEAKREGGPTSFSRLFLGGGEGKFGGGGGGGGRPGSESHLLDDFLYDRFGRRAPGQRSKSTKGKLLSKMLPNHLELHPPNHEAQAKAWKRMVEGDVAAMRQRSNRTALRKALLTCGLCCDDWDAVSITDCQLTRKGIDQIVGMAVAQQLAAEGSLPLAPGSQIDATFAGLAAEDAASPAAAGAECQPTAMQTDEDEAAAAAPAQTTAAEPATTTAAGPAATTAAGGIAADVAAGTEQEGRLQAGAEPAATVAANGGGAEAAEREAPPPLWTVRAQYVMAAADAVRKVQQEASAQPEKQALRDVAVDQYEKQLLSEASGWVIPPEEINVSFDDIGALEAVKNTLHEVVILPLQRPELFMRGALTKPTKGLLLFGPPGTGKTMLAKAVASESGAHFINVNMSAITSKWFGEGERLVRALFGLAHKLSPSVIFVDEIDSFLSKRGQSSNEHEALRKMKNEFMTHWDGLRTKQADRVLVLAATNRPMDLDDAVIRRMPRRIFVPLPDAANRERILQVILKDEDLDPAFDFKEAAALSDGYSGSDLKNLCIAAAYCPIREFLERERAAKAGQKEAAPGGAAPGLPPAAGADGAGPGVGGAAGAAACAAPSSATPAALANMPAAAPLQPVRLRPISMADFREALKQVTASTHSDSATTSELQRWNDQYGEGGSRRKEPLAYYT